MTKCKKELQFKNTFNSIRNSNDGCRGKEKATKEMSFSADD